MDQSKELIKTAISKFRNDPEVEKWRLERKEARRKFRELFRLENLDKLTREEFNSFLNIENNRSWTGLQRRGTAASKDMERIKKAISHLQDEKIDVSERLHDVVDDKGGEYYVDGMGRNLATAILYVCDEKDQYGVWNDRSEKTLKKLGLIPKTVSGNTPIRKAYPEVNKALKSLENYELKDLNEVDHFMWWADTHPDEISERPKRANVWLEKTIVSGRLDRESGPYSLGKALWSPQRDKKGADIYGNMRKLDIGDRVLHLVDNDQIVGISKVKSGLITDFHCLPGTAWDDGTAKRPGYLRELNDFKRFDNPIYVYAQILKNDKYKELLKNLLKRNHDLFYTSDLKLREGAYLTEVPEELLQIFGEESSELGVYHTGPTFSFTARDFESCTGKEADAKYLCNRFKDFRDVLEPRLNPILREKLWVPRPNIRGKREYWNCMWVGTTHQKFKDPRKGVQFQVYINKDSLFIGIWIQGNYYVSKKIRKGIKQRIESDKQKFWSLKPPAAEVSVDDKYFEGIKDTDKFLDSLIEPENFVYIGQDFNTSEAIGKGPEIVDTTARIINELLPLYSFIIGEKIPPGIEPREYEIEEIIESGLAEIGEIEKTVIAHLVAGKNLVFCGPPGTGKTRNACKVAEIFCGKIKRNVREEGNFTLETGNAEWTTYDVTGGPAISGAGEFTFKPGFFTLAARKCNESLEKNNFPHWLIIDEMNRANLDLAFGKVFTLLDIDYREKHPLLDESEWRGLTNIEEYKDLKLSQKFRILATMNTYDRAILFSLGYAFRRRFAFVGVPSPFREKIDEEYEANAEKWRKETEDVQENTTLKDIRDEIGKWIKEGVFLQIPAGLGKSLDLPKGFDLKTELEKLNRRINDNRFGPFNPYKIAYKIAKEMTNEDIVEPGYAQPVDVVKCALAYTVLFSGDDQKKAIVKAMDEGILAYYLPHLEYFLPRARREMTIGMEEGKRKPEELLGDLKETFATLGLIKSSRKMEEIIRKLKSGETKIL